MGQSLLNLAEMRPWWLRTAMLALIGSPLFHSSVIHSQLHKQHFFEDLGKWTAYAVFIWLFVTLCVGINLLVEWLTVATLSSLTILFTGAILRQTGLWDGLATLLGSGAPDRQQSLMDLIFRVVMIMTATPFALLVISSFPASDLMRWVSQKGATRTAKIALIAAMFLRIFQHVGEVVTRCMVAWTEENPTVLLPRYRSDWVGSIVRKVGIFDWLRVSVFAWCIALATQSLVAIPTIVRDFRRVGGTADSPSGEL
jgi:hypothetical protein